jgi:hypothetical protein
LEKRAGIISISDAPVEIANPEKERPLRKSTSIDKEELLTDIRLRMSDSLLMQKYRISPEKLQVLLSELVDQGFVTQSELDQRTLVPERIVDFSWKCPACEKAQVEQFEECPICGVIVSKFLTKRAQEETGIDISKLAQEAAIKQTNAIVSNLAADKARDWTETLVTEISAKQAEAVVSKLAAKSAGEKQFEISPAEDESRDSRRSFFRRAAVPLAIGVIGAGLVIGGVLLWKGSKPKPAQYYSVPVPVNAHPEIHIPTWEEHLKSLNKYGNHPSEIIDQPEITAPIKPVLSGPPKQDVELPQRMKEFFDRFYGNPRLIEETVSAPGAKPKTVKKIYNLNKMQILKAQEANITEDIKYLINPKHLICISFSAQILCTRELTEQQVAAWRSPTPGFTISYGGKPKARVLGIYNVYVLMDQNQRVMGTELTNEDMIKGAHCPSSWSLLAPFPCKK